jgi:hypothetical protein
MNQEILLLRDYSELSDEVEKYLKENDFDYLCFYPHKENSTDSLPEFPIILPPSFSNYEGKRGFKIFKETDPPKKKSLERESMNV